MGQKIFVHWRFQMPGSKHVLSRRTFGTLLAATGPAAAALNAQQNQAPPAPGNFRRPLAPETAAFEGTLVFTRKGVPPGAEPSPLRPGRRLSGRGSRDVEEWSR